MNFKKIAIVFSIGTALISTANVFGATTADVQFSGTVTGSTCNISAPSSIDLQSVDINDLVDVATATSQTTVGSHAYTISVEGCPASSSVGVAFTSDKIVNANGSAILSNAGNASGVGVKTFISAADKALQPVSSIGAMNISACNAASGVGCQELTTDASGNASMGLNSVMVKSSDISSTPTAGTVSTSATFTVIYK